MAVPLTLFVLLSRLIHGCGIFSLRSQNVLISLLQFIIIPVILSWKFCIFFLLYFCLWICFVKIRQLWALWMLVVMAFLITDESFMLWVGLPMSFTLLSVVFTNSTTLTVYAYLQCRAIVIGSEMCSMQERSLDDWLMAIRYFFYPPTLISGSMISLQQFSKESVNPSTPGSSGEVLKFFFRLLFSGFLYFFCTGILDDSHSTELSKNFFTTFQYVQLGSLKFYLFHVQLYGWIQLLCKLDGYQVPIQPICVYTVYLYSDMWRYFDRGMAFFLKDYIYRPLGAGKGGRVRAIFNASCCFAFVIMFHGLQMEIISWGVANFVMIQFEIIGSYVMNKTSLGAILSSRINARVLRHITIFIVSHQTFASITMNSGFMNVINPSAVFYAAIDGWASYAVAVGYLHLLTMAAIIARQNTSQSHLKEQ